MNKIAFLDRDGVINDDTGHYYIYKAEHFVLSPNILESIKLLSENGYLIIVITNQGGIARGTYSKVAVDKVHSHFIKLLKGEGIDLTAIYYCPHHDKFEKCLCRKPQPLMIEKALARYNGDLQSSFMIGDNLKDVEAANAAGIKGYKIEKNTSILPLVKRIVNENL